ncbi:hypothetical protein HPULCUR_008636 [Helicostylum pulchrum]|uniref:Uncharacterized protein n=1 Tax=Helicostylum pulchrum TaxID=562976 RepID=A0ABP9Y851_9FUNG
MAIPLGWEAVILRDRNISRLKLLLNNLDHNQYFKHSHLTTTLAFRETRSRRDSYTFNGLELLELLNQLPNLKEVDFKLVYNPEEYVGYLLDADMQHINHIDIGFDLCDIRSDLLFSLTDLHITTSRQNIFNWIDIVGMDLALRLIEKAGGIDETYVRFILREEYQERANDEKNTTKYFKLLNSFRGTRQTHCTASFNEAAGEIMDLAILSNTSAVVYYASDLNGSIAADVAVPDKASSIIGPEIFGVLKFNLLNLYDDDDVYRVLNYSLSNCPRLQSLSITWSSRVYLGLYLSLALTSSNRANCDIDVLQMENITLTKNLADLVTAHFHNIEIISLGAADWDNPVIDLAGFGKLKSVKYTSTNIHVTDENKFVLIKYTNGTEERRILEYGKTKGMGNPRFTVLCDISVSLDFCASTT